MSIHVYSDDQTNIEIVVPGGVGVATTLLMAEEECQKVAKRKKQPFGFAKEWKGPDPKPVKKPKKGMK